MDYTHIPKICHLFNSPDIAACSILNDKYYETRASHEDIKLPRFISGPKCYLCKQNINRFHWFYYSLCPTCGNKSYEFRNLTTDLTGYRAIVTGARIKLGYRIALKLLRFGAEVLVTSRKWTSLLDNYQKEPDYQIWKHRLHIAKINFDLARVDELLPEFVNILDEIWGPDSHIDIIIHNAAQTIDKVVDTISTEQINHSSDNIKKDNTEEEKEECNKYPPMCWSTNPYPIVDKYARVLDKRQTNTWSAKFGTVNYLEAKQVLLINAWAPFVLNEFLLPRLLNSPNRPYIIHVHAKEGHFSSHKTLNHTHTNMAKAALAMLTRCLGGHHANPQTNKYYQNLYSGGIPWFSRLSNKYDNGRTQPSKLNRKDSRKGKKPIKRNDGPRVISRSNKPIEPLYPPKPNKISTKIKVHGVDPGWFSVDEYPLHVRQKKHLIFPPIDDIDAASRIVYPIIIEAPSFPGTWKHYVPLYEF
ncbi:Hypothetical protein HVR_LOCUS380 [uncultured virus]|nr:Hypothetical protein HVR_LOCUS380 [uncultured virus]